MESHSFTQIPPAPPPLPILLLEEEPDPLPKWMAYYRHVSYVLYSVHIIFSCIYLANTGIIQYEILFHIQYEPVNLFLGYNSYSILCPVLSILFAFIFMYHVRKRVKLSDGDFFGLLGILLMLCLLLCYDVTGIYHLYDDAAGLGKGQKKPDDTETNELAWQYAWSTKPTCARQHALINQRKKAAEDKKNAASGESSNGPSIVHPIDDPGEVHWWMYSGLTKDQLIKGLLTGPKTADPTPDPDPATETADEKTYRIACGRTYNSKDKEKSREWMVKMQKQFECCGPYGRKDWDDRISDIATTCRNKKGKQFTKSCARPFNGLLRQALFTSMIFMLIEISLFLSTMIIACFHFAAMKYDETRIAKEYSLLELHEDDRRTVIAMPSEFGVRSSKDPVQDLFHQANIRAEKGRRSTGELHFPSTLKDTRTHLPHTAYNSHHVMKSASMKATAFKAKKRSS